MKDFNYDLEEHRSQLVTRKMLREASIIVYMDNGNLRRIRKMGTRRPVLSLGSMCGKTRIPDPAFQAKDSKEFRATVDLIIRCSKKLAKELM